MCDSDRTKDTACVTVTLTRPQDTGCLTVTRTGPKMQHLLAQRIAMRRKAGKQTDVGSSLLWLSFLYQKLTECIKLHGYIVNTSFRAQEPYGSQGGRPGRPVPNSPYGLSGHKATLNLNLSSCDFLN